MGHAPGVRISSFGFVMTLGQFQQAVPVIGDRRQLFRR
jgi:hypothetical protein